MQPQSFVLFCEGYRLVQWLQRSTIGKLSADFSHVPSEGEKSGVVWEERKEAEGTLERYLIDEPSEHYLS